jgi:hypothetical protein
MARRALYDNIYDEIRSAVPEGSRDSEALMREAEGMDTDAVEVGGWGARQNKKVRLVEDRTEIPITAPASASSSSSSSSRTRHGNASQGTATQAGSQRKRLHDQIDGERSATSNAGGVEDDDDDQRSRVGDDDEDDDNALMDAAKASVEGYILTEDERRKRCVLIFFFFCQNLM